MKKVIHIENEPFEHFMAHPDACIDIESPKRWNHRIIWSKKLHCFTKFFSKTPCILFQSIIYYKSLLYQLARFACNTNRRRTNANEIMDLWLMDFGCKKAMKQEVAELSGNFCRELSVPETGEGILVLFALCKKIWNTRRRVPSDRKFAAR